MLACEEQVGLVLGQALVCVAIADIAFAISVTNIVLAEEKYKLQDMLSATSVGEADSVTRARNARHKARRVEREGRERSSLGSF